VELNNQLTSVRQQQTDERVQEEQLQIARREIQRIIRSHPRDITYYSGLINTLDDSLRRQESQLNTRPAYSTTR
jgi:hypothetical protein